MPLNNRITFLPLLFLFVLGSMKTLHAQTDDNLGVVFKVQVAASENAIAKSNKLYQDFPELEEILFEDGYYRYYAATFEGYHQALDYLDQQVKPLGYPGAYVIGLQGRRRMTADEAIMLIYGE